MTLECLRSVVQRTRDTPFELIVVDNESRDGSAEAIAAEFPEVRLIRPPENLGFARANNLAVERARGDLVLLLNPDTVVLGRAVDALVEFAARRPEAGIWGGRTLSADGSLAPSSCWRRITLWSLICNATGLRAALPRCALCNPEAYAGWDRGSVREVDIVTGCFLLITRQLWHRLGGFDPAFFMYGEEADLCHRARRLGARPLVTPDATIIHYGGASERVKAEKLIRLHKARVSLIRRHFPRPLRGLAEALECAAPWARRLAYAAGAAVRPAGARGERAQVWTEVCRRRREWAGGYEGTQPWVSRS
jgi:GT2 family glycosyltransferase